MSITVDGNSWVSPVSRGLGNELNHDVVNGPIALAMLKTTIDTSNNNNVERLLSGQGYGKLIDIKV